MNKLIGGIQIAVGLILLTLSGTCAFILSSGIDNVSLLSDTKLLGLAQNPWVWMVIGVALLGLFAIWQGVRLVRSDGSEGQAKWTHPLSLVVCGLVVMVFLGLPGLIVVAIGAAYFAWRHHDKNER